MPKISAGVDGGPSRRSSVRRPGSEEPHQRQRNYQTVGWLLPVREGVKLQFSGISAFMGFVIVLVAAGIKNPK